MANSVGRLWVAVDADVRPAMRQLAKLDQQVMRTKAVLTSLGQTSSSKAGAIEAQTRQWRENARAAEQAAKGIRRVGMTSASASRPVAALQAATYRLSQSFINLRYGNPIGTIAGLAQAASSARAAFAGMSNPIVAVGVAVGALAIGIPAAATAIGGILTKVGLESAANFEMLEIQYEGLLGSARRAQQEIDYILDLGTESVVPTENLLEANRLLLAYGITADGTRRKLIGFMSDFGSATGISQGKLQDMAYALGQVESQGKANMIDLKQLANAGLNLADVYRAVAKQQNISVQEARALTSEGKMTADVLIPAITSMGDKYKGAADKARDSVQGILANLKDIVNIKLGRAFEGVLDMLKPILVWVQDFIQAFDFSKIAAAVERFVGAISDAFGGMSANAEESAQWFEVYLPAAIAATGETLGILIRVVRTFWEGLMLSLNAMQTSFNAIMWGFAKVAEVAVNALDKVGAMGDEEADAARAYFQQMQQSSAEALDNTVQDAINSANIIKAAWSEPVHKSLTYSISATQAGINMGQVPKAALAPTTPEVQAIFDSMVQEDFSDVGGSGKQGGGGSKEDPAKKRWQDWLQFMRKLVDDFTKAYEELRGLARGAFGEDSDIKKALLFGGADDGFQGDIDGTISMYEKLRDTVTDYYRVFASPKAGGKKAAKAAAAERDELLKGLNKDTAKLVVLARTNKQLQEQLDAWREQRTTDLNLQIDELTKQYDREVSATETYYDKMIEAAESALDKATQAYEDAASKLADLVSARDDFLSAIMDSARSFVNGLSLSTEMLTTFTRLDDAGSFLVEEKQKTASFQEQMQQRLQVMKTWAANVKSLMARGLDGDLLRELISQGPESSAEVVQQLTDSSDAALQEINATQAELASTVASLQSSVSKQWFDAGIAEQERYVAQTRSAMDAAQATLTALQAKREETLAAMKASYEAQRTALEEQLDAVQDASDEHSVAITALMQKNADAAAVIAQGIEDKMSWLTSKKNPKNTAILGQNAMDGLIKGLESKEDLVVATAQRIADRVAQTIARALDIHSPSRLLMAYGAFAGEGLAIGMESSLARVEAASMRLSVATLPSLDGAGSRQLPELHVYLGDKELTELVDARITTADGESLDYVTSGRRY